MPISQSYKHFKRIEKPADVVWGAVVLGTENLNWEFIGLDDAGSWVFQTNIEAAANNESVVIRNYGTGFEIESKSIGESSFAFNENETNVNMLFQEMESQWLNKTDELLTQVAKEFKNNRLQETVYLSGLRGIGQRVWEMITFKKPWNIALVIGVVNVLVFLVMAISGAGFFEMDSDKLIQWGANYTLYTAEGQYWRLLTATFLHGGVDHLFSNIYGLVLGGFLAEKLLGKRRFLLAYLLCGIFSSAVSFYMHDEVLSVGASGAIFGCFGVVLGLASTSFLKKEDRAGMLWGFGIFVGINLIFGMKDGIDNWAHLGGLISGWVGGVLWSFVLRKREDKWRLRMMDIAIPAVAILCSFALVKAKPDRIGEFTGFLSEYDENTNKAFRYFPADGNFDSMGLLKLHDSGLYYISKADESLEKAFHVKGIAKQRQDYIGDLRKMNKERYNAFYYTFLASTQKDSANYNDSINAAVERYKALEKKIFPE